MSVLKKYDKSFFTCSICLSDEFSNGDQLPLQLNCDHIFHISCYNSLLNHKMCKVANCPNCRRKSCAKRIPYEIFEKSQQIFLECPLFEQIIILWINNDSTFKDIIIQLSILKGESFDQLKFQKQLYFISPVGKIISYDVAKSHYVQDYAIAGQQKLILRLIPINQDYEQEQ
ncbi:RING finger protein (macronuclear) [Tetrahymena thermophila SB210]|uniref:RING finger protein n=1 Tax=Tetrahymena thermophila (strain SB210) TaxID=312017 RepID=W7X9W6_TETTS|nr:RING finger protein [Tetrahymena thermophila SB210]EWS73193.1 RING finger protein [Tetrahymena thermophila SB210]|eukprot:XP_012654269.1 RING finger protein [Tetrahymena thermophila SB210]